MAFTEVLRMVLQADTAGAVRGIQKVGATTDKELGRSQKNLDKLGRGLTVAGAGMVAFGGAALLGLGKAAMASEEAELGFRKLQNSIANNPKLAAASADAFRDQAEAIQDVTAADADAIVAGQAVLAQRKLDAAQIKELTPLVVDLARKKGIDEVAAFTLAAKAVDGNSGALKRAGISIDEAAFKSDAFGATVDALRSSVGGFAEEEGKTFAGSLERMKNELGDVVEGVGAGAVDAFTTLFGVVDAGSDKLNEISPAAQNAIGKFATFGSVALIAAGGLSFTIGQLIRMRENFSLAASAAANFAGSGGLGRLAKVSLVVGGLIALREVLMSMDQDLEGIDVSTLENELLDLADTGKLAGDQLTSVFEDFGEAIESGDPQKLEAISNKLGEVDKALAQLASRDPKAAAAAFQFITDQLERMGASSGQIKSFFNDYAAAVAETDTVSRTAAGGVDELGGAMGDSAEGTEDATSALQEYSDTLAGLTDPVFAAMDAITGVRDAQLAEADAAVAVVEARAALNEALASGTEAEVAEATRGLADAERDLTDAQFDTVKSAAEADAALAGLQDAAQRGDVSVDEFRSTLATWVRQGFLTQDQANRAAKAVGGLAGEARDADKERVSIPVSTPGTPRSRSELRGVRDAAHSIPPRRSTAVSSSGTSAARQRLREVRDAANSIPSSRTIFINVAGAAAAANALARAGRQHGGPVLAGEAYVVGEAGPELLLMGDRSGRIIPNGGLGRPTGGAFAGSGGAATVIHVHVAGSVIRERELVSVINRQLDQGARLGRNGRSR